MITIEEFCDKHKACKDGREWALVNCKDMQQVWESAKPEWLIWVATRKGVLTDRELRLFACFCARQNWHLLTDERSRNAVRVAESFAHGESTNEELAAPWAAAWYAARDAAKDAARDAARDAAGDAAGDAAWYAAGEAAWYAAGEAAWYAARDAARAAQCDYLRKLNPRYE